jgi:hypothetical protein
MVASPVPWVRASGSSPASALDRIGSSTIRRRPWCGRRSAAAGPLRRHFFLDQCSPAAALWWSRNRALQCLLCTELWRPTCAHVRRTDADLWCPTDAAVCLASAASAALWCAATIALRAPPALHYGAASASPYGAPTAAPYGAYPSLAYDGVTPVSATAPAPSLETAPPMGFYAPSRRLTLIMLWRRRPSTSRTSSR